MKFLNFKSVKKEQDFYKELRSKVNETFKKRHRKIW